MLKIVNALVGLVVLSTLAHSQEIVCQNGRCDVIKAVAKAPLVVAEKAVERVQRSVVTTTERFAERRSARCSFVSRLRKRFR